MSFLIDTYTEENFIIDTIAAIRRRFRSLSSVRLKWFIHQDLPKDKIVVEWSHRSKLELEIDIAQWFTAREKLECMLWHDLGLIKDELDPMFQFNYDYVYEMYGPNSPRERYYELIRKVWSVYNCGRLAAMNLPVAPLDEIKGEFFDYFGEHPIIEECFQRLYFPKQVHTFRDIENISKHLHRNKTLINK